MVSDGYDIHMTGALQGLTLTPMAEFLYQYSGFSNFKEEGSSQFALYVDRRSRRQRAARFGLDLHYLMPDLENPTTLGATIGVQKHWIGQQNTNYHQFQQSGGGSSLSSSQSSLPSINDAGIFWGGQFTRMLGNTSTLKAEVLNTNSRKGNSQSLQLTVEKKI